MSEHLFIGMMLTLVGLSTLFLLFLIANSAFLPRAVAVGIVLEKEFIPEHENANLFSMMLNGINPIISYHEDEWILVIAFESAIENFSVDKKFYDSLDTKDQIGIKYTISRFTKEINLVAINYPGFTQITPFRGVFLCCFLFCIFGLVKQLEKMTLNLS
ncbi:MAG: hypothetical protein PHG82_04660 [Candidatus Gracilibacteria bacterium]|nr:hypothetical protein [Candidatus Gracilibacteria bacterium]